MDPCDPKDPWPDPELPPTFIMACKSLSGDLGKEAEEERAANICPVLPRVRPDIEGGGVAEDVLPSPLKYDLIPA